MIGNVIVHLKFSINQRSKVMEKEQTFQRNKVEGLQIYHTIWEIATDE